MSSQNDRLQGLQNQIEELRKRQKDDEGKCSTIEKSILSLEKDQKKSPRESITNILLTIFSGLLFIGAMLQWSATRDAIKDTHTSFQIGTRAWVIPKGATVRPTKLDAPNHVIVRESEGIKDSQAPAVSVTLVNSGHSPARDAKTTIRIEVADSLVLDNYVFPSTQNIIQSASVIAPDGLSSAGDAYSFSGNQFNDVKNGKRFLTIYGISTYLDIFGDSHETKFCYFYDWVTEKMPACPHYNSAN
jgi:hypothetical protein